MLGALKVSKTVSGLIRANLPFGGWPYDSGFLTLNSWTGHGPCFQLFLSISLARQVVQQRPELGHPLFDIFQPG